MSVKLLALDMDGTLLNEAFEITPRVKCSLDKAIELGVVVTPATGRAHPIAASTRELFDKNFPIISSNGAYVRDEDRVYYESVIPHDIVAAAMKIAGDMKSPFFLFEGERIYSTPKYISQRMMDKWGEVVGDCFSYVETDDMLLDATQRAIKMLIVEDDEEKASEIRRMMNSRLPCLHTVMSEAGNIDLTLKEVHKGNALKALCKRMGIDPTEVMAVGDGENDIEMIEFAGIGVAMGNACEGAKAICDYVTADNEHDGVAIAVEKYILGWN